MVRALSAATRPWIQAALLIVCGACLTAPARADGLDAIRQGAAQLGAVAAGQNWWRATGFCAGSGAPSTALATAYLAQARRRYATDPTLEADLAAGWNDHKLTVTWERLRMMQPEAAANSRATLCQDLAAQMQRAVAKP